MNYFLHVLLAKHFAEFLGRWIPAPRLDSVTTETFAELEVKYRSQDGWGMVIFPALLVGLAAVYDQLLYGLAVLMAWRFGDAIVLLPCDDVIFRVLGALLSFVSTGYFYFGGLRWFLGREEYDVYLAYRGLHEHGVHEGRAFMWAFLLLFLPLWVVSALEAATFTALTNDALYEAPFGAFGVVTAHPYTEIRNIYFAKGFQSRNGFVDSPQYVIVFKDGYRWATDNGRGDRLMEKQVETVERIAQQSGRPITKFKFADDIPH